MGRTDSPFISFLWESLKPQKYNNLRLENEKERICSIYLPRKTKTLSIKFQHINRDWYTKSNRVYIYNTDYSKAKSAIENALKKSVLVDIISHVECKLFFRFLSSDEATAKNAAKVKKFRNIDFSPWSVESGYWRVPISPENNPTDKNSEERRMIVYSIQHDHDFGCLVPRHEEPIYDNVPLPSSPESFNATSDSLVENQDSYPEVMYHFVNDNEILVLATNEVKISKFLGNVCEIEMLNNEIENISLEWMNWPELNERDVLTKVDAVFQDLETSLSENELLLENEPFKCKTRFYEIQHRIYLDNSIVLILHPKWNEVTSSDKYATEDQRFFKCIIDDSIIKMWLSLDCKREWVRDHLLIILTPKQLLEGY